jgi:hypothetical protein
MKKKHYSVYDVIATRIVELKIIITGNASLCVMKQTNQEYFLHPEMLPHLTVTPDLWLLLKS